MATNLKPLPPLPTPTVPVVDLKTGLMNPVWYTYFKRSDEHLREAEQRITTLE